VRGLDHALLGAPGGEETAGMDTRTITAHDLARRSLLLMQRWDDTEAAAIIHPDAANDEAISEPPAAWGRGPAAFKATYDWLHAAFEELRWEGRTWWPRAT
jgi:hypothetical protein